MSSVGKYIMVKLPNFDGFDLLRRAKANPDAAADVLLLAAKYMRRGEVLPDYVADHLAGAFEAAMRKPQKHRGKALLNELHITASNRRPADVDCYELGKRFDQLLSKGHSESAAASQVAVEFNISESTAKRVWADIYKAGVAANKAATAD